jgi:hypothetical protein
MNFNTNVSFTVHHSSQLKLFHLLILSHTEWLNDAATYALATQPTVEISDSLSLPVTECKKSVSSLMNTSDCLKINYLHVISQLHVHLLTFPPS